MDGMTDTERFALWAKEEAEYEARFANRKAVDYHTNCRDCGVFVKKSKWVKKDDQFAVQRNLRPLCWRCFDEYD
ncbi:hypothetical protein [Stutzerimonas frequens]|uniref:hypothetical protein n=1 Tax=Stutzerimonas frequens TaxID=2968969 RepID=UPI00190D3B76|nr:hypothetical protein [Stutzerimonas frequens]MBK3872154.1 hypothetical protein [Stutzerimonas frequens]MBK3910685.1 hypothetical protein [Stutzerimonas frequens]MBK3929964.1 hypothetical protein [Stutzerimonas frequens]